jgi:hypothetical protein
MKDSLVRSALSPRGTRFALGAAALLVVSILSQRTEAMSPIGPGSAPKAATSGLTIEVRGGHGGGGGRGGGGWGGGHSAGGVSGSFVRGGAIGAASVAAPLGVAGAPRFAGHGFAHRHRFGRVFVGGVYYDDYPYDDPDYYYPEYPAYPAPAFVAGGGCHRVLTVHGPRVVCHRAKRHYHRVHRRHHHRRHHRA